MKKIAGKVTDIDFFSRKITLPTCPIECSHVFFCVYLFVWNCSVFQKSWIYIKNTDHEKSFKHLKWYVSIYFIEKEKWIMVFSI